MPVRAVVLFGVDADLVVAGELEQRGRLQPLPGLEVAGHSYRLRHVRLPREYPHLERERPSLAGYDALGEWAEVRLAVAVVVEPPLGSCCGLRHSSSLPSLSSAPAVRTVAKET